MLFATLSYTQENPNVSLLPKRNLQLHWRGTQAVLRVSPHVPECTNSNCFVWSDFPGWVLRQSTKSCRAAGAPRPCPWPREGFPFHSLWQRQLAAQEMLPAPQHLPGLLDLLTHLMQRMFSRPKAIYWHIRGECCGFCFVYHLANEVFVCVCASALLKRPPIYHACDDIVSSAA